MPNRNFILNLPGFTIQRTQGCNPLILEVHYRRKASCPSCRSRALRKKDSFIRQVHHESIGIRRTILRFKAYKFQCKHCGRYFNQHSPGIGKYQRPTERLQQQVFYQHTDGISQQSLAQNFKLGKATIERWYHQGYLKQHSHIQKRDCPKVLGIDEHTFSKKQPYATTFCDLQKHKVFDVVKGHRGKTLKDFLIQLNGKQHVKLVCIDLSSTYRKLIKTYFPNAKIVADRFHVIRLLNHMCLQTYHNIDPTLRYHRGLLGMLRKKPEHLTSKQIQLRQAYFQKQPAIAAIYDFKQRFHRLLMFKHRKAKYCKRLLPIFRSYLQQLKHSPFKPLATLANTFYKGREEIVRMWQFVKNNSITEGFHRKIKLIQRRAYGFRNFQNYRLSVKLLCA